MTDEVLRQPAAPAPEVKPFQFCDCDDCETKATAPSTRAERAEAESLQRGNVIGRISAHLLGNKNNVTDEDVVIAAAEVGRELQGAKERAERTEIERQELRLSLMNAEARAERTEQDAARLKVILCETAREVGAALSPQASIEFMCELPKQARAFVQQARIDALNARHPPAASDRQSA